MKRLLVTVLVLAASLPACRTGGSVAPDADAGTDGGDMAELAPDDASDPVYEPHCCPLDSPSCDCPHVGGTPDEHGTCATVCNVRPEGWISMIDEDGCLYWSIPADADACTESAEPEAEQEPEPADEPEPAPEPEPEPDPDAG